MYFHSSALPPFTRFRHHCDAELHSRVNEAGDTFEVWKRGIAAWRQTSHEGIPLSLPRQPPGIALSELIFPSPAHIPVYDVDALQ
jgi:hypothetical protein